ncbi:ABC transporter permease [Metapseudomonas resinovorans]|uniref:Putative ABC transporter permease protein n=1 Tax=Metapseudomonas resinovorans NBRC 106553 TaxID=1245471 RepID=S6AX22_METRE|nr:ABC transporter permease [Pseudomonas resinovorans]BAN49151.1 putative ABC transporter permease protein [Pseudomonas resinovorans NBRC 106553]
MRALANILHLGLKEFHSLRRDRAMLLLILWAFSLGVYSSATGLPEILHNASVAIVDEDDSQLSSQLVEAFQPPLFHPPLLIDQAQMDRGLDTALYTFTLGIPPNFQRDLLAGRRPALQLNVDATQVAQAFSGAGYIRTIVEAEVRQFVERQRGDAAMPVELVPRMLFNPNLTQAWLGGVMEVINQITMLSIILTGAALIRERERGTLEHLLVMPLGALEIMLAKVWSMGLVVLLAALLSLQLVVRLWLGVPLAGSLGVFLLAAALHLFATTSLGILLGTVARSMPQLGLLTILVLVPLQILSGSTTPRESMPQALQTLMLGAPTTHFVILAESVFYRGAGLEVVWPRMLATSAIGAAFFAAALMRLRRTISQMA